MLDNNDFAWGTALAAVVLVIIVGIVAGFSGCTKPKAGEIGVIRNGGVLDNKNIRGTVDNGSGITWAGFWSDTHYYPVDSQQRFFRMATCGDNVCKGADGFAVKVPTADGVDVEIEGTFYLNTTFNNSPEGLEAVQKFDTQFATRTFGGKHPYEGVEGWEAFLGAMVEPVVVNNLRETVAGIECADLVSSCALVQNSGAAVKGVEVNRSDSVVQVQKAVQEGLSTDLKATLRGNYFGNVQFRLSRVVLPEKIQSAINDAQSAFAQVSQAQAKIQSAKAEAKANEERQRGYDNCEVCGRIDTIKELPKGLQALGGDVALGISR